MVQAKQPAEKLYRVFAFTTPPVNRFTAFNGRARYGSETAAGPCVDRVNARAKELTAMTYAAPTADFYDDGLVHSHDWSRSTPPGSHHAEGRVRSQSARATHDHDEGLVHDHRWARQ
jgi:hypothetical protein